MRLLSLFDGTGSICKPFREAGWEIQSLDVDGRFGATLVEDILLWDYSEEPTPDVIFSGVLAVCLIIHCTATHPPTKDEPNRGERSRPGASLNRSGYAGAWQTANTTKTLSHALTLKCGSKAPTLKSGSDENRP